jgi:hypothetical protein
MYSLALIIFVVSEKKAFEHFPIGSNVNLCIAVGKNVSKRFFSETTCTIETKLPRNDHWKVLYKIHVFYVDRKSKMAATAIHRLTLDPVGHFEFHIGTKNVKFVEDHPMNIHVQFGFNQICSF